MLIYCVFVVVVTGQVRKKVKIYENSIIKRTVDGSLITGVLTFHQGTEVFQTSHQTFFKTIFTFKIQVFKVQGFKFKPDTNYYKKRLNASSKAIKS